MNETTENFWKAWAEPVPEPAPVFSRLYYDEQGNPLCYSMEDLPGNYIDIDVETYARSSSRVRVVDGKLIHVLPKKPTSKLVPDGTGTPCSLQDVSVVVSQDQPHIKWSLKTNESN
jgi:hypothetical protein